MSDFKIKEHNLTGEALIIGMFIWFAGCSVSDAIKDASKAEMDYRYRKEEQARTKAYFDRQAKVDSLTEARRQIRLPLQP